VDIKHSKTKGHLTLAFFSGVLKFFLLGLSLKARVLAPGKPFQTSVMDGTL
jgi:hypothetical protein